MIIIVFSDVTAIVLGIFSITGVHTYYGADFISFGIYGPYNHYNYKYFSDLFINTHDNPYRYEMPPIWRGDILNSDNKTKEEFDCSHTSHLLTLPIGVDIELAATNKNVSILNDWIK